MSYKVLHLSDTHSCHGLLEIPDDIDLVIHSGDCSNGRDQYKNEKEVKDFIKWFGELDIPNKVFVPGNHEIAIWKGLVSAERIQSHGIKYLNNDWIKIDGYKIWGSPVTPTYGDGWAWNTARHKTHKVWDEIPDDTDIIVTHGPPKGILDLTYRRGNKVEMCGCAALRKKVFAIEPKLMLFGHIHSTRDISNAGVLRLSGFDTIFSNGSCVVDGKRGKLSSHGNIIELEE